MQVYSYIYFSADMPKINLPAGLNMYYLDENPAAGMCVLLLHGLGANSDSWQLQIPVLTQAGFRVLAPDLRSFGRTGFPGSTSIAAMAADCRELLDALQIAETVVCGISMGGNVAQQIALDYPQRTTCLVLINTFAHLRPPRLRTWIYFVWRFILIYLFGLESQARIVAKSLFPRPDQEIYRHELYQQVIMADPRGYRATMLALARFDSRLRLPGLRIPALIITSSDDTTVPPPLQTELVDLISGARQQIVPAAGHAVIVEKPEIVNHTLLRFLGNCQSTHQA
jgi:3-oxoadipate enol-lactonase